MTKRQILKFNLKTCSNREQHIFKRMYANGKKNLSLDEIIDNMHNKKIKRAMEQVKNTLDKTFMYTIKEDLSYVWVDPEVILNMDKEKLPGQLFNTPEGLHNDFLEFILYVSENEGAELAL